MADLFADIESTIDVPFNNGVVVTMRKYSDAGIQEDLEAESSRMRMHQGEDEAPVDDEDADSYCLLYTSPSPRDRQKSRMPSSA